MENPQEPKKGGSNTLVWVLIALIVLVVILGGGLLFVLVSQPFSQTISTPAPTETMAPSPTALPPTATLVPPTEAPTATLPLPTPTPLPGDPAEILGKPRGIDTFDNANNWTLFDNDCFKSEITNGAFIMTAKGVQQASCWELTWPLIQDYYMETTVQMPESCQPEDRFGLLLRAPDNQRGYLFGLTCDGRYALTIWDGQNTTVVVDLTPSPLIKTGSGEVNRLGILPYGDTFALYANGALLQTIQDDTYPLAGKIGFFVRASTDVGFTATFDNLAVWLFDAQVAGSSTGDLISVIATAAALTPTTGVLPTQPFTTPLPTYPVVTVTPTPVYSAPIVGVNWYLVRMPNKDGDPTNMPDPDKYVLKLNSDATVSAVGDCNTGTGVYRLRSEEISIDMTRGTSEDCGANSYSELYFSRLESVTSYTIDGNRLTMSLTSGGTMDFTK